MNTDIRLSVNFFNHIKTLRLKKACGLEGIVCLQKLWVWAAVNRPSGDLSGFSALEIEAVCDWGGDEGCLISALREIGWLDGEEGSFQLHGWEEFQLWARGAEKREDMGRMSALARKNYAAFQRIKAQGGNSVSKEEYARLTKAGYHAEPDPGPTPIPIPVPIPTPKKKVMGAEKPKDQNRISASIGRGPCTKGKPLRLYPENSGDSGQCAQNPRTNTGKTQGRN